MTATAEIAVSVSYIEHGNEKRLEGARQYAAMTYGDKYQMVVQAIIGDREDLRQKAWELVNSNDGDRDFIWIRAKLITDLWKNADAKGRQEFMEATMLSHLARGTARQIEDYTDESGQDYHQYLVLNTAYISLKPAKKS